MSGAWFSPEWADSLRFLSFFSLLSLLSVYPIPQGQHRTAIVSIWIASIAVGVLSLAASGIGMAVDQPPYVLRRLLAVGIAFTVAFGGTLKPMLNSYREAEIRRTVARDI